MFEVKFALKLLSYKLVVYCQSESEQIRRLMMRNNFSETEAKLRIEAQMNSSQRMKLADYLIDNSNDLENTRRQIKKINEILKKSNKHIFIRLGLVSFALSIVGGFILIPVLISIF